MLIPSPVLVTGGAGYVGSALISRLLSLGGTVRALDWNPPPTGLATSSSMLSWMEGDIRDDATLRQAVVGSRAVVHLASIADADSFEREPVIARSINVEGLRTVLSESATAAVESLLLVTHSPDLRSRGFHATEVVREDLAHQALARGLTVATVRVPSLCGWSPRMRFDLPMNAAIAREFMALSDAKPLAAPSQPSLHLDDLVDLVVLLLALPPTVTCGGVFEVCPSDIPGHSTNRSPSMSSLAATATGGFRSLTSEFGWVPRRSPDQARGELRERLSRGEFPDPLTNPAYHNAAGQQLGNRSRNRSAA
jgi:nucleoside-diphosphate-sugar epimerase